VFAGKLRELFHISVKDLVVSLILGIFGFFFYQIATFSALARIPASMNAILISTSVIFIALLSVLILKEKILVFKILGILLSLAGVILVTFNRGFSLESKVGILGCLFSLSGAVSFALYTIFGKRVLDGNDPLIVSTYSLFSGAALLTIFTSLTTGFGSLASAGTGIWLLIIMISVTMIGVAYPLWFFCLKRMQASHVSIYIYLTPVFGVILSLIILKERFSGLFWLGAAFVLAGIVITSALSRKKS
jgi:drug/metabolite transporter (DMT)-like permease